jgi:hypothetical protein
MLIDSQVPMHDHAESAKNVNGTINCQWKLPKNPVNFLSAKFDQIETSRNYINATDNCWILTIHLDPNYHGCKGIESVRIVRFSTGKVELSVKFVNDETKYCTGPNQLRDHLPIAVENLMLNFD